MNREQFINAQEEIYNKSFRDKMQIISEFVADPVFTELRSFFAIVLRHSEGITNKIFNMVQPIMKNFPVFIYPPDIMHTTLIDYKKTEGNKLIVKEECFKLMTAVEKGIKRVLILNTFRPDVSCKITYGALLWNETTIIVPGTPNKGFVFLINKLMRYMSDVFGVLNLPFKFCPTWGAHISVARFFDDVSADNIRTRLSLINTDIGESTPYALDVIFAYAADNEFHVETLKRFPLF